ncbi:hypothetical protein T10_7624, partial [Trichinella papuae]
LLRCVTKEQMKETASRDISARNLCARYFTRRNTLRRVLTNRESCVRIHRREGFQTQWFPTLLYANKDDPLKIALSLVTI